VSRVWKRPNQSVLWSSEYILQSTDPSLVEVKDAYNRYRKLTDSSNGWHLTVKQDADPTVIHYVHTFGPTANRETIEHIALMYYHQHYQECRAWHSWVQEYVKLHNIHQIGVDILEV
jgi:hypothetical protein